MIAGTCRGLSWGGQRRDGPATRAATRGKPRTAAAGHTRRTAARAPRRQPPQAREWTARPRRPAGRHGGEGSLDGVRGRPTAPGTPIRTPDITLSGAVPIPVRDSCPGSSSPNTAYREPLTVRSLRTVFQPPGSSRLCRGECVGHLFGTPAEDVSCKYLRGQFPDRGGGLTLQSRTEPLIPGSDSRRALRHRRGHHRPAGRSLSTAAHVNLLAGTRLPAPTAEKESLRGPPKNRGAMVL